MQETQDYVEKVATQLQRPLLPGIENAQIQHEEKQYQKAFSDYVRSGNDTALKTMETKAYRSDSTGSEGGFLIAPHLSADIRDRVEVSSPMRSVAHIVKSKYASIDFLIDPDDYSAQWVSETGTRSETNTGLLRKITIRAHDLYAMPKAISAY